MIGQTSRAVLRSAPRATLFRSSIPRRTFILSPAAGKRGTWKGAAARWALVIGGVYYYNTSNVFAEEPIKHDLQQRLNELPITHSEDDNLPTVEGIAAARKQRLAATSGSAPLSNDAPSMSTDSAALSNATSQAAIQSASQPTDAGLGGPQDLEEEASQQGAFNEETGEINWDCPCLGGMAHGPCGPEFREAFSCFVFSKEEPKGIDCIDRFKGMQDCFRQHPDIYGAELSDDEDPSLDELPDVPGSEAAQPPPADAAPASARTASPSNSPSNSPSTTSAPPPAEPQAKTKTDKPSGQDTAEARTQRARAAKEQVARDHPDPSNGESLVPREWHDTRGKNESK